jgi:hypothetical protein
MESIVIGVGAVFCILLIAYIICGEGFQPPGYGYDDDPWWKFWGKRWWKETEEDELVIHSFSINAANSWGPEDDPYRRWFLAGWSDEEARELNTNSPQGDHQSNPGPWAAYLSGVIAFREQDGAHLDRR